MMKVYFTTVPLAVAVVLLTGCNQTIRESVIKIEQSIDIAGQYISETIHDGQILWVGYEDPLTDVILENLERQGSLVTPIQKTAVIEDVARFRRSYSLIQRFRATEKLETELISLYRARASVGLLSQEKVEQLVGTHEQTVRQLKSVETVLDEAIDKITTHLGNDQALAQEVLFPYDHMKTTLPDINILLTRTPIMALRNVPSVLEASQQASDLDGSFAARAETVWPDQNLSEHYNIHISDTGMFSMPADKPAGLDFPMEKLTAGSELLLPSSQSYVDRAREAETVLYYALNDYIILLNTYHNLLNSTSGLESSLGLVRQSYQRGLTDKASLLEAELRVLRHHMDVTDAQAGLIFSYTDVVKALGSLAAL